MDAKYYVYNQQRQSLLHLGVGVANTSFRRLRGLMGKWSLRSDDGLWVIPSKAIHTIGLFFSIDVVYLDESRRVVHLIENLKPFRIAPVRIHCESVLELPPRSIYNSNTQVGDQLLIMTPEQMRAYWEEQIVSQLPWAAASVTDFEAGGNSKGNVMVSRLLQWLKSEPDRRGAPREPGEGLVAFYWEGGVPQGRRVKDISWRGAYIEAGPVAWAQGTLMVLMLQIASNHGSGEKPDSIAVPAEVVRTSPDGMGLRFLYRDFEVRRLLHQFLSRWKANSVSAVRSA